MPSTSFADHRSLIGHTRMASTGEITEGNAHPFRLRSIVGAHNGIVRNHAALNARYGRAHTVDSLHLLSHLEDNCDLSECEAYGALAWVDLAERGPDSWRPAINLARFNNGELTVADVPGHGVVWASTESAVLAALALAGLERAEVYSVRESIVYAVADGRLFHTDRRIECADPWKRQDFKGWDGQEEDKGAGASAAPDRAAPSAADPWHDADLADYPSTGWTADEWDDFDRKIRGDLY